MEWEAKYCKAKGKVLGEKTKFFTNIRDPKLVKLFVAFFFSSSSRRFYHLWGKKIIVRFGLSSCITIFKAFCLFFQVFFQKRTLLRLAFFFIIFEATKSCDVSKNFQKCNNNFQLKTGSRCCENDVAVKCLNWKFPQKTSFWKIWKWPTSKAKLFWA